MNKMYYAYSHKKKDNNQIFYIGIAKKNPKRLSGFKTTYSRAFSKKSRNVIWKNIVNKHDYIIDIIFECDTEDEIIEKEKELIKFYGKIINKSGILCNMTDGGHGIESFNHSLESKRKIGESSKNRIRRKGYSLNISEEGKKSLLDSLKNRIVKDSTRQKMSNNLRNNKRALGHKVTDEHIMKTKLSCGTSILQYDLQDNFIKEWVSFTEICEFFKIKNYGGLKRCCDKITKNYRNYVWKYKEKNKEFS